MTRLTHPIALLLFFLFFAAAHAQEQKIDSLKKVLQNPKLHDTARVRIMAEIMDNNLILGFPDKDGYGTRIKAILDKRLKQKTDNPAVQKAFKLALANWYYNEAAKIMSTDDGSNMLKYFNSSLALFKEVGSDEQWTVLMNKGLVLRQLNRANEAFECFFTALRHYEKIGDANGIALVNIAIGLSYAEMDEIPKAIAHYSKSVAYYGSLKNPTDSDLYQYMGVLGSLGTAYSAQRQYDKAKPFFHKEIAISEKLGNTENVAYALESLGNIDVIEKKYKDAIAKYEKGLSLTQQPRARTFLLLGLWKIYFNTNRIEASRKYLLEAHKNAELTNEPNVRRDIYESMYQTEKATKNFGPALEMLEKYHQINDSMNVQSAKDELKHQQLKYTFEKKELKLKLEAEKKNAVKNNWLIGLSGVLLLIVLGCIFYYRNSRQKQSIAVLEKNQIKQKLLITQMNPHFIFNSVHNIRNLIDNHQNADAVKYLDKFAVLTRQILEHSNENYISLEEEVDMIRNYLAIQQLLYNHKFDFEVLVEEDIDTESTFLPPMLTQPFIENAIKHGLGNKAANGKVEVRFFLDTGKLFFEVTDNGKGFDANKVTTNHKSLAMTITKERLVGYTKNQDFNVQTDNIKDQHQNIVGAKVRFEIPYIYEN